MGTGKLASQAGHAYVEAALNAQSNCPDRFSHYRRDGLGTKICLGVENEKQLLELQQRCQHQGVPATLITDHGCTNFFGGKPTITALGVGPVQRHEIKPILGHLKLL